MKTGERVFTADELRELDPRTLDILLETIEAGDKEKAKKLANRMYKEYLSMHDLYRNWSAAFMSYIYEKHGYKEFYEALKWAVRTGQEQFKETYAQADFRRRVKMLAMGLRGHLQGLEIQEDDEKVCVRMTPCGSGERLFKEGGFGGPPHNFTLIKEASPLTYGDTDFPIYCSHACMQEILWTEWFGYPVFVSFPVDKMGRNSCWYCIYKDPDAIPEEVYARVGMKKPAGKITANRP
ncbi:MAG: hypothetical protein HYX96_06215 [Chloroflexi bacterium]|nr:hypothetical protein [Chloroflexota bacterium]